MAVDEQGRVVGVGDLKQQTEQAFRNVQLALEAADATFADVVKTRLFVVGLKPGPPATVFSWRCGSQLLNSNKLTALKHSRKRAAPLIRCHLASWTSGICQNTACREHDLLPGESERCREIRLQKRRNRGR